MTPTEHGFLAPDENHPAVQSAMRYLLSLSREQKSHMLTALSSTAADGNRLSEVCCETFRRLDQGEQVSERCLLGLAWTLRDILEKKWRGKVLQALNSAEDWLQCERKSNMADMHEHDVAVLDHTLESITTAKKEIGAKL